MYKAICQYLKHEGLNMTTVSGIPQLAASRQKELLLLKSEEFEDISLHSLCPHQKENDFCRSTFPCSHSLLDQPDTTQSPAGAPQVRAAPGADRGSCRLGLGPPPGQRARLQRQGKHQPRHRRSSSYLDTFQNGFTVEFCLANPDLIATAKCSLPLEDCLANPQYIALPGCLGNEFSVGK